MPPQVNATLTKVAEASASSAGAGVEDWDASAPPTGDDPGDPGVKWSGELRVYYREATDRTRIGATEPELNVAVRRELIIDAVDARELDVDTNDVVTFTPDGQAETTGVAKGLRIAELAGVPSSLQTAKLTLEDK